MPPLTFLFILVRSMLISPPTKSTCWFSTRDRVKQISQRSRIYRLPQSEKLAPLSKKCRLLIFGHMHLCLWRDPSEEIATPLIGVYIHFSYNDTTSFHLPYRGLWAKHSARIAGSLIHRVLTSREMARFFDRTGFIGIVLRWLDTVSQGQYLSSLSINYGAINKVIGGKSFREWFWKNSSQCRYILL